MRRGLTEWQKANYLLWKSLGPETKVEIFMVLEGEEHAGTHVIREDVLREFARGEGIPEETIDKMWREARIYQPRPGWFSTVVRSAGGTSGGERAEDILRRAGYQAPEEREHGDRVREVAEKVKEYYIQDLIEEGFSPEQAHKEVEDEWDWEGIISDFKENIYGMWPCEQNPKFVEALEIVRQKDATLYDKLAGRCFVLSPDFYPTTTAAPGVAAPMTIDKERRMAIIISGGHAEEFTPQALARTLAHEAMHIDMDENPEKYGIKSFSQYFVMKMVGETDTVISKRLEEMDLEKYRVEIGPVSSTAWRKARYKIWPEDAVFRMTAYLKGRPSPPRWEG